VCESHQCGFLPLFGSEPGSQNIPTSAAHLKPRCRETLSRCSARWFLARTGFSCLSGPASHCGGGAWRSTTLLPQPNFDDEGHSRFEWLINRSRQQNKGRLIYYVFDLLYLEGEDLRTLPLIRRKASLKKLVRKLPNVIYVDHIEEHGRELFRLTQERGIEGILAKDK
jgi:hypothetical protein